MVVCGARVRSAWGSQLATEFVVRSPIWNGDEATPAQSCEPPKVMACKSRELFPGEDQLTFIPRTMAVSFKELLIRLKEYLYEYGSQFAVVQSRLMQGTGVGVPVCVAVTVIVGVRVGVNVSEGPSVGVSVLVGVNVRVGVNVSVAVAVGVAVSVGVGVLVGVDVSVGVAVSVGVRLGVFV